MAERFNLFRLSLLRRPQLSLFADLQITREQYLRQTLSKTLKFSFYKNDFVFVPEKSSSSNDVIIGRIGRPVVFEENRPPEEGLKEALRDGWRAIIIVIDPTEHPDGQKVAVKVDPRVGKSEALIRQLIAVLNDEEAPYTVEVEPIVNVESFWQFAKANEGNITNLIFEFIAPNMFGGTDDLSEELREFRKNEHAEKVTIALASRVGLDTSTSRTHLAVDYALKGAGKVRAKTKSGKRYNSSRVIETSEVNDEDFEREPTLAKVARLASRILGRD